MTPAPAFQPSMLFDDDTLVSVPPSICDRSNPRPAVTYGRTPAPRCPPIGTPTITLPIRFSTVLLPKSLLVPKKLGLYPKSTSPPMTPAPIAPAVTPNVVRPLSMLLPNADPIHGDTKPSARAVAGAHTSTTAPATIKLLSARPRPSRPRAR